MVKIVAGVVFKALAAYNKAVNYIDNVAVVYLQGASVANPRNLGVMISENLSSSPKKNKKK